MLFSIIFLVLLETVSFDCFLPVLAFLMLSIWLLVKAFPFLAMLILNLVCSDGMYPTLGFAKWLSLIFFRDCSECFFPVFISESFFLPDSLIGTPSFASEHMLYPFLSLYELYKSRKYCSVSVILSEFSTV